MRRALVLVCLSLVALPAAAQMPQPWAAHVLPADFLPIEALACADEAAFASSGYGAVARFDGTAGALPPQVLPPPPVLLLGSRGLWADRAGRVLFTMADYGFARWADGAWTIAEAPLRRESVLPRFTGVCATRTHVIVAERALQFPPRPRIWVRPLQD